MRALHAKSLLPQGFLHADMLVHWRWMVLPELSRLSLKLLNHSLFLIIFASLGRGKPFFIFFLPSVCKLMVVFGRGSVYMKT